MSPENLSLAILGAVVGIAFLYFGFVALALKLWQRHGAWRWHVQDLLKAQSTGDWSKLGHACVCFWCGVANGMYDKAQRR